MNAHRIETILAEDRTLKLEDLPFRAGDAVEVIILERAAALNGPSHALSRASTVRHDDPIYGLADAAEAIESESPQDFAEKHDFYIHGQALNHD